MSHPQERSWRKGINKQTGFFLCVCTYGTHLAGFFLIRHVALGSVQYTHSTVASHETLMWALFCPNMKLRWLLWVVGDGEYRRILAIWRSPLFESWVNAVTEVHYIIILLLRSWGTPQKTAGELWVSTDGMVGMYILCSVHLTIKPFQPSQAENGRGPSSSYTRSLVEDYLSNIAPAQAASSYCS